MLATETRRKPKAVERLCGWRNRWEDFCVFPWMHYGLHLMFIEEALSPWQRARLEHFRQR